MGLEVLMVIFNIYVWYYGARPLGIYGEPMGLLWLRSRTSDVSIVVVAAVLDLCGYVLLLWLQSLTYWCDLWV